MIVLKISIDFRTQILFQNRNIQFYFNGKTKLVLNRKCQKNAKKVSIILKKHRIEQSITFPNLFLIPAFDTGIEHFLFLIQKLFNF